MQQRELDEGLFACCVEPKGSVNIKPLLEKGANVNAIDGSGNTPLHIAVKYSRLDIVNLLLEKGAKVNAQNHNGNTPLHMTAAGHCDKFETLLKNGADLYATDKDGNTALHIAAAFGKSDIVNLILKKDKKLLEQKNGLGNTPLHIAACFNSSPEVIKVLLDKYFSDPNIKNNNQETPLDVAIQWGSEEAEKILRLKTQNHSPVVHSKFELIPIRSRLLSPNENLNFTLKNALQDIERQYHELNSHDARNPKLLHAAVAWASEALVCYKNIRTQWLQKDKKSLWDVYSKLDVFPQEIAKLFNVAQIFQTAIHFPGLISQHIVVVAFETAKKIITSSRSESDIKYYKGKTPEESTLKNEIKLAQELAKLDWPSPDNKIHYPEAIFTLKCAYTLDVSVWAGRLITDNLALPSSSFHKLNIYSLLFLACTPEFHPLVEPILKSVADPRLTIELLDNGFDVNGLDGEGNTPLHTAAYWGYTQIVTLLLQHGADATIKNKAGKTAREVAEEEGHNDLLSLFDMPLEKVKALTTTITRQPYVAPMPVVQQPLSRSTAILQKTPEHQAELNKLLLLYAPRSTQTNHPIDRRNRGKYADNARTVEGLLDEGADVHAMDECGNTALHLAAKYTRLRTVELLLNRGANIEAKNHNGNTPLHIAVMPVSYKEFDFLLEKGANLYATDKDGNTVLHIAAIYGNHSAVRKILDKDKTFHQRKNNLGNTPLHMAACLNLYPGVVEDLLDCGANPNIKNNNQETPLDVATQWGSEEAAKILKPKTQNYSPVIHPKFELVPIRSRLFVGDNIALKDITQKYHRLNPNDVRNPDLLHAAITWASDSLVYYKRIRINYQIQLFKGEEETWNVYSKFNVLSEKIIGDVLKCVKNVTEAVGNISCFLQAYYDYKEDITKKKSNISVQESIKIVQKLADLGEDWKGWDVADLKDFYASALIALKCAFTLDPNVWQDLITTNDIAEDIGLAKNITFFYLLFLAGTPEFHPLVEPLLRNVADPRLTIELLDNGFDVNGLDEHGNTPLHTAAYWGYTQIVTLLLQRSADATIKNKAGKTAREVAEEEGHNDLLSLFDMPLEEVKALQLDIVGYPPKSDEETASSINTSNKTVTTKSTVRTTLDDLEPSTTTTTQPYISPAPAVQAPLSNSEIIPSEKKLDNSLGDSKSQKVALSSSTQSKVIDASRLDVKEKHNKIVKGDGPDVTYIAYVNTKKYFLRNNSVDHDSVKKSNIRSVLASKLARAISKQHFVSEHLLSDGRVVSRALPDTSIPHPHVSEILLVLEKFGTEKNPKKEVIINNNRRHDEFRKSNSDSIKGMGIIDEVSFYLMELDRNQENIMFSNGEFNSETYAIKIDFNCCNFVDSFALNPDEFIPFGHHDSKYARYAQERSFTRLGFSLISDCFIEALVKRYCPIEELQKEYIDLIKKRRDLAVQHLSSKAYGFSILKNVGEEISRATQGLIDYAAERFSADLLVEKSLKERQVVVKALIGLNDERNDSFSVDVKIEDAPDEILETHEPPQAIASAPLNNDENKKWSLIFYDGAVSNSGTENIAQKNTSNTEDDLPLTKEEEDYLLHNLDNTSILIEKNAEQLTENSNLLSKFPATSSTKGDKENKDNEPPNIEDSTSSKKGEEKESSKKFFFKQVIARENSSWLSGDSIYLLEDATSFTLKGSRGNEFSFRIALGYELSARPLLIDFDTINQFSIEAAKKAILEEKIIIFYFSIEKDFSENDFKTQKIPLVLNIVEDLKKQSNASKKLASSNITVIAGEMTFDKFLKPGNGNIAPFDLLDEVTLGKNRIAEKEIANIPSKTSLPLLELGFFIAGGFLISIGIFLMILQPQIGFLGLLLVIGGCAFAATGGHGMAKGKTLSDEKDGEKISWNPEKMDLSTNSNPEQFKSPVPRNTETLVSDVQKQEVSSENQSAITAENH